MPLKYKPSDDKKNYRLEPLLLTHVGKLFNYPRSKEFFSTKLKHLYFTDTQFILWYYYSQ